MPDPTLLQLYGFLLVGVTVTLFAVFDGFDLGIGMVLPFLRRPGDRRILINAIWPVWDANQLWALISGGALFALYPALFATVFSVLYPVVILLMVALLFRPITFELWNYDERGRRLWEWSFFATNLVITFTFGAAYGAALGGLPFTGADRFGGSLLALLRPMPLLTAALFVSAFLMHGGAYAVARTHDPLQATCRRLLVGAWSVYVVILPLWAGVLLHVRQAWGRPWAWAAVAAALGLAGLLRVLVARGGGRRLVVFSGLAIAAVLAVIGTAQYPVMLAHSADPAASLTASDSSPDYTLRLVAVFGTVVAIAIGAQTTFLYRVFRHRIQGDDLGY